MRHFEMINIMNACIWYENIAGEWVLVTDSDGDPEAMARANGVYLRSLFNPNTIPADKEVFYK